MNHDDNNILKITVADNAGACYGVNRSLEIVLDAAQKASNVATLGELIHNPIVVNELQRKHNITSVASVKDALANNIDTLVIRSHGVPIDVLEEAEQSGINIIDATCPHVKHVQDTASDLAKQYRAVIIIGKAGHPEVQSVSSYVKSQDSDCFIVETKDQADSLLSNLKEIGGTIGVVSQTTQSSKVFDEIIAYLKEQGLTLDVKNTICAATKKRQDSAVKLAKQVDTMIVLGGLNSSNTKHLADLCKQNCDYVYHIESGTQLDKSWFEGVSHLGISAGASTPKSQIDTLLNYLH